MNQTEVGGNTMQLDIAPLWGKIETVREEAKNFLEKRRFSSDDTNALIMIASELIENAIKYGHFSENGKVVLTIDIEDNKITIEAKNPIDKEKDFHLKNLDKTIQWIRGFQTPFEAYIERLRQVSNRISQANESGLGLVRIAYEGQSIIDFYINKDDVLAVSAVYPLNKE